MLKLIFIALFSAIVTIGLAQGPLNKPNRDSMVHYYVLVMFDLRHMDLISKSDIIFTVNTYDKYRRSCLSYCKTKLDSIAFIKQVIVDASQIDPLIKIDK